MTSVTVRGMDRAGRPLDGRVDFIKATGARVGCNLTAGRCFLTLLPGPYTLMFRPVREYAPPPRLVTVPRAGTISVTVRSTSVPVLFRRPFRVFKIFRGLSAASDPTTMSAEQARILLEAALVELDSAVEPRPDLAVEAGELARAGIVMGETWPATGSLSPVQHSGFSRWVTMVEELMAKAYGRKPSSWLIPIGLVFGSLALGYALTR